MKYKLSYLLATLAAAALCVCFLLAGKNDAVWEQQHLTALPKEECLHGEEVYCTHLPVLSINTEGQEIPGTELDDARLITVRLQVFDQAEKNNHLTDAPSMELQANIRYRGNSSRFFSKHSYLVKTVGEDGLDQDYPLLGMPEGEDWALHGPFLDKTLIRNYLCMNVAGQVMGYAPRVRFCELWLDGEYQGLYVLMERVSRGEERINITPYEDGDPFTSYIIRLDRGDEEQNNLTSFSEYAMKLRPDTLLNQYAINVEYPPKAKLTSELKQYIEEDLSQIEKAVYSYDYDDDQYGYSNLLDVSSFVDYFIINEFFQNYDAGVYSTYLYKDLRGRLAIGPVWDFNNACDNYMETAYDGTDFGMFENYMYFMLIKDEDFTEQVIARYRELRQGVLSEESLLQSVDDIISFLGDAVERNYQVWGYSFDASQLSSRERLDPADRNPSSYEEAVEHLKSFLKARGQWLDRNIENLRQYSHESKVKSYNP